MYVGRDLSQLTMESKQDWQDKELGYFHYALSQSAPYLNSEGVTMLREINNEIKRRGGLTKREATWTHGTHPVTD
ncbi:cytosolic protein [Halobacillus yeomjeoni]|uniref:Cytosolic protein n=1 Tax=Halobacillus yeomjeoni TaxID=311194 RepID=A0A931HX62_9BACI|nr:cytosolic protein [Halobacillus yeomjeoni]MBH0231108.1 cytosolic protein [Halobacillus yeomjeoni]MCA0984021.1 cytosolic protein [Halobacillus yeomjeoni]